MEVLAEELGYAIVAWWDSHSISRLHVISNYIKEWPGLKSRPLTN